MTLVIARNQKTVNDSYTCNIAAAQFALPIPDITASVLQEMLDLYGIDIETGPPSIYF